MSGVFGTGKGARNISGQESEQSKVRRGVKNRPDVLVGKGSTSDTVKKERQKRKKRLSEINKELGL